MKTLQIIPILLLSIGIFGQISDIFDGMISLTGTVYDAENEIPLAGANIVVIGHNAGAATDINGEYRLDIETSRPVRLVISYVGYKPDTVRVSESGEVDFSLTPQTQVDDAVIIREDRVGQHSDGFGENFEADLIERRQESYTSLGDMLDGLGGAELKVCCALDSRSSLSLLGLPGAYTEITVDGAPEICGLASSYRLYSYPAIGIQRISVKKGPSSAQSQAKTLGGHVDIQTRRPSSDTPEGSVSIYARSVGGYELQGEVTSQAGGIGSQFSVSMLSAKEFDANDDGWTESPAKDRIFTRFKLYFGDQNRLQANLSGLHINEEITGGMTGVSRIGHGHYPNWIRSVHSNRFESTLDGSYAIKNGQIEFSATAAAVGLDQIVDTTSTLIDESGIIGEVGLSGDYLGGELYSGISYRLEEIDDEADILDRIDERISFIVEEKYRFIENLGGSPGLGLDGTLGLRVDGDSRQDNGDRTWAIHPRMNAEFRPTPSLMMTLRLGSGGRFRPSAQDLMEGYDQSIRVVVPPDIEREKGIAANFGLEWKLFGGANIYTFTAMGYHTDIQGRIVPVAAEDGALTYTNADGKTQITGAETGINAEFGNGLNIHTGMDFTTTHYEHGGASSELPFTPLYRGFAQLNWDDFVIPGLRFFSTTMLYGPQKLPENVFGADVSEVFSTTNLSGTFRFGAIQFHLTVSNIFDQTQDISPVQGTADPFLTGVSSELVYGPLVGRTYQASFVYHFGSPADVLQGFGYDGRMSDDTHSMQTNHEHSADCSHGVSRPTANEHIHGPDCDHSNPAENVATQTKMNRQQNTNIKSNPPLRRDAENSSSGCEGCSHSTATNIHKNCSHNTQKASGHEGCSHAQTNENSHEGCTHSATETNSHEGCSHKTHETSLNPNSDADAKAPLRRDASDKNGSHEGCSHPPGGSDDMH